MFHPSVSCLNPLHITVPDSHGIERGLFVPCGKCSACLIKRTREWTLRLIMEAQDYDPENIAFVTLTYSPEDLKFTDVYKVPKRLSPSTISSIASHEKFLYEHPSAASAESLLVESSFDDDCPVIPTLYKRDVQLFLKRLRKKLDYPIRFYAVGEYGLKSGRPHYHLIVYGLKPVDFKFVEQAWSLGFVLVKNFYRETCGYVAGYIQKKLFGPNVYGDALPPFLLCSQRLGESYFWRDSANILHNGYIAFNGYKYGIPRLFRRKAEALGLIDKADPYDELDKIEYLEICQNTDMHNYESFLMAQGADHELYEHEFRKKVNDRFEKSNVKRDFNTEV